jgi:hypothetical protein
VPPLVAKGSSNPICAFPHDRPFREARAFNPERIDALIDCLLKDTCGPNQRKVVILATYHFGNARAGHVSGEDIW